MITQDPLKRLSLFCDRAKELRESPYLHEDGRFGVTIKSDGIGGAIFSSQEPNNTNLRSFLITFRQFFLEREPINIFAVYNLCLRYMTNDKYKDYLIKSRELLKKSLRQCGFGIVRNGHEIAAKHIMDLFVNGEIFHSSDEKKMEELRALFPHESAFYRFNFFILIDRATKQVLYTERVIRAALNEGSIVVSEQEKTG